MRVPSRMNPHQQPRPQRRPLVLAVTAAAVCGVLIAAAVAVLLYAGRDGGEQAAAAGPDSATVTACEAAAAITDETGTPTTVLLGAAAESDEGVLRDIATEFETGGPTTGPAGQARALAAAYKVSTWCIKNGVGSG